MPCRSLRARVTHKLMSESNYKAIYKAVRRIPRGRVATYGQIAALAGLPGHARQVGYALHACPAGDDIPWQRVINAAGEISPRGSSDTEGLQRAILESEGVTFDENGRVDLRRFGWKPRTAKRGPQSG